MYFLLFQCESTEVEPTSRALNNITEWDKSVINIIKSVYWHQTAT